MASSRARWTAHVGVLGGLVAFLTPLSLAANTSGEEKLRLKQVQVTFRHGARTPYRDIPSEPRTLWYQHEIDSKKELGLASIKVVRVNEVTKEVVGKPLTEEEIQTIDHRHHPEALEGGTIPARLTRVGMEQAVELGRDLRRRYVDEIALLPKNWGDATEWIFSRSTETERTIETAQGVLTGMFPGEINAQAPATIFLKSREEREWGVANFGKWCPRLTELFQQGAKKLENPITDEAKKLLQELQLHVKLDVPDTAGAFRLSMYRDQIACRKAHGKELPKGSENVADALDRLNRVDALRIFKIFSGGSEDSQFESTRLHAGRMLHRLIKSIENHSLDSHKLLLYSGHDWTIIMLLLCVDPYAENPITRVWPKFCSDFAIELWEESESKREYVRILLDGKPLELPYLSRYAEPHEDHGPTFFPYEIFREALEHFMLQDHEITEKCKPLLIPSSSSEK